MDNSGGSPGSERRGTVTAGSESVGMGVGISFLPSLESESRGSNVVYGVFNPPMEEVCHPALGKDNHAQDRSRS